VIESPKGIMRSTATALATYIARTEKNKEALIFATGKSEMEGITTVVIEKVLNTYSNKVTLLPEV
jgi:hypothetical protein